MFGGGKKSGGRGHKLVDDVGGSDSVVPDLRKYGQVTFLPASLLK